MGNSISRAVRKMTPKQMEKKLGVLKKRRRALEDRAGRIEGQERELQQALLLKKYGLKDEDTVVYAGKEYGARISHGAVYLKRKSNGTWYKSRLARFYKEWKAGTNASPFRHKPISPKAVSDE